MVVKMMKWRPWPVLINKKFQLRLLLESLEGLSVGDNGSFEKSELMAHVKWKGPKRKLGSRFRSIQRNCTALQRVRDNGIVEWNENFDHVCVLTMVKDNAFHRWDVRFEIINALGHEPKSRPSVVATAFLNLGEFAPPVKSSKQTTKIPVSCFIGGVTTEAALVVTLDFVELQTSQEAFDPVHRLLAPSLSCIGGHMSEKGDPSALKSDLQKEPLEGKPVKTSSEEDGSDCKLSPRSEECESPDLFDSESTDECNEDDAEDGDGSSFWRSFSYDTLAAANLSVGAVYLDCKEDEYGDYESRNIKTSLDPIPKLIDEPSSSDSDHSLPQPAMRRLLSWKSRKFSFRSPRAKGEPLLKKAYGEEGGDDIDFYRRQSRSHIEPPQLLQGNSIASPISTIVNSKTFVCLLQLHEGEKGVLPNISQCLDFGDDQFTIGSWEQKELVSRDGQMKLSVQVFFASIDQRSEQAAGESACTALVAVIADWLHNNHNSMPIKSQFDLLIREGSLEWRKLCDVEAYKERFPDRHFDLDTVLQAKVRPLSVVPENSFIGFFRPEGIGDSFEFLQGSMSFDNIWDEITNANMGETQISEPQIYIVSWNDHFFVLKVEKEAFYIIDTLGERLSEGCNQAYILKFDQETALYQLPPKEQKLAEEKSSTTSISATKKDSKSTSRKESKLATTEDAKSATTENAKQNVKNAEAQISDTRAPETLCDKHNEERLICKGKESCKAFINGFLAALPLRDLQGACVFLGLNSEALLQGLNRDAFDLRKYLHVKDDTGIYDNNKGYGTRQVLVLKAIPVGCAFADF
eukprot:Gb_29317 [translate_table: standard]